MPAPDPYLTAEQVRARRPKRLKADQDPEIAQHVSRFEGIAELYIGQAFREREFTFTGTPVDGVLHLPYTEVTACTIDGVAVAADDLDVAGGKVHTWACGPVTAAGTHGVTEPPEILLSACAFYVERMVTIDNSGSSRDTLSKVFEGGISERYSTPNWAEGRPTGFLQVDADLNSLTNRRFVVF